MPDFHEKKKKLLEELQHSIKTTGKRKVTAYNAEAIADSVDHTLRNQILIMEALEFLVEDKI